MRLWRWLCCRTGHHRETVREGTGRTLRWDGTMIPIPRMQLECVDCQRIRILCNGLRSTPSRRYALRGKA